MSNQEQKNYAALRYSGTYGEGNRCIGLKFNQCEIVAWFQAMTPDDKGNVRVCIAPRKTPSDANKFTMFQDTWKPKDAPNGKREAAAVAVKLDESDSVPF